eukprot:NODE_238_length_1119_cov_85.509073_g232_i0.p1 GENE.NODE_238_length_1119_cov_85.509073_g232_i0~~NODE_238_length_1119_cov_85.509073_g232_i0.p1  ORF type:complete len:304 (+),score=82.22 NODE_238_length_1119_cov_85.509073_g232_i0:110-1021(+)
MSSQENKPSESEQKDNRKPRWIMLESNPAVMNPFIEKLGCPLQWGFSDCYGLSEDLLAMVPKPVFGIVLLYPTSQHKALKAEEEERIKKEGQELSDDIYFMKQIVGMACGSIAVMHILINAMLSGKISIGDDAVLRDFYNKTNLLSIEDRGKELGFFDAIATAHEKAGKRGQTRHDDFVKSDFHFIGFIEMGGYLYEMDGTKAFPINHGKTTQDTFLQDAAMLIQTQFMNKAKEGEKFFNILTFGQRGDGFGGSEETTPQQVNISDESIATITAMGFDTTQAKDALIVCAGNVESAINYLLSG